MSANSRIYWACQIIGWSFYVTINLIFFGLRNHTDWKEYLIYMFQLPVGIGLTHLYRMLVLHYEILEKKVPVQLIFILLLSFLMGVTFFFHTTGLLILYGVILSDLSFIYMFEIIVN